MFGSLTVAQPYSILPQDVLLSPKELWGKRKAGGMDEGHCSLTKVGQPSGEVLEKEYTAD